ncbi:hypothetical protein ACL02U_24965, partial [Streptomyces sp. MS06]|uniref:hypothetical protein n=1 Tax=Streptomyces sp. MS06 TaxID=3385974 RepID=UPI00399F4425
PSRKAKALPRNAKFRPPVHLPILGGGVLATLLCLPVLLVAKSSMPGPLAWLLCALAVAALLTGVTGGTSAMLDALLRDTEWTVEDEADPSIA